MGKLKIIRSGIEVGFCQIKKFNTGYMNLDFIFVKPDQRGKGFGSLLLDRAINYAKRNRCSLFAVLDPEDGGLTYEQEELFFVRHGFERTRNYRKPEFIYRKTNGQN
jgi:Sortase and related acyltransferases